MTWKRPSEERNSRHYSPASTLAHVHPPAADCSGTRIRRGVKAHFRRAVLSVGQREVWPVIFRRTHRDAILRRTRRRNRVRVDLAIGIAIPCFIAGGKADNCVAIGPYEIVQFARIRIITSVTSRTPPGVCMNARSVLISL